MMPKIYGAIGVLGLLGLMAASLYGLHIREVRKARAEGISIVETEAVAKANQQIAERRIRDANFDRMDAMALCKEAKLEWIAEEGRSYCRAKPAG